MFYDSSSQQSPTWRAINTSDLRQQAHMPRIGPYSGRALWSRSIPALIILYKEFLPPEHLPVNFPWLSGHWTIPNSFAYGVSGNVPFLSTRTFAIKIAPPSRHLCMKCLLTHGAIREWIVG